MDSSAQGPTIDWEMLARYVAGVVTPGEREAIEHLVATDPASRARIDALRAVGRAQGQMPRDPDTDSGWQRALVEMRGSASRHLGLPLRSPQPSDAADGTPRLSVFHGPGARGRFPRARPRGVGAAVTSSPRHLLWPVATLGTAGGIAAAVLVTFLVRPGMRLAEPSVAYTTGVGQRETVTLSDGTQFTLAPGSRVRVVSDSRSAPRSVALEGRALFTVAHDSLRPFRVYVRGAVVEDLGTQFVVDAYADAPQVEVAVTRGRVAIARVQGREPITELGRGDVAVLRPASATRIDHAIDVDAKATWAEGELRFTDTPLVDAARELTRWYGIKIELGDSVLASRQVTAAFRNKLPRDVLQSLALVLGARLDEEGDHFVLTTRR